MVKKIYILQICIAFYVLQSCGYMHPVKYSSIQAHHRVLDQNFEIQEFIAIKEKYPYAYHKLSETKDLVLNLGDTEIIIIHEYSLPDIFITSTNKIYIQAFVILLLPQEELTYLITNLAYILSHNSLQEVYSYYFFNKKAFNLYERASFNLFPLNSVIYSQLNSYSYGNLLKQENYNIHIDPYFGFLNIIIKFSSRAKEITENPEPDYDLNNPDYKKELDQAMKFATQSRNYEIAFLLSKKYEQEYANPTLLHKEKEARYQRFAKEHNLKESDPYLLKDLFGTYDEK